VSAAHAVSVDLFHMTMLANDMLTTVRQGLSQQVRGRRGRATDPAWANRMLLLKAEENLSERGRHRLPGVFAADDSTGSLQVVWQVKEQLRTLLNTSSLKDAGAAKNALADLVARARCRKQTDSTGPCAVGGPRSKSSSSPVRPQAR
jgi:hypothetical protein